MRIIPPAGQCGTAGCPRRHKPAAYRKEKTHHGKDQLPRSHPRFGPG
jgi:hypothetical protein